MADTIKMSIRKYICFNIPVYKHMVGVSSYHILAIKYAFKQEFQVIQRICQTRFGSKVAHIFHSSIINCQHNILLCKRITNQVL